MSKYSFFIFILYLVLSACCPARRADISTIDTLTIVRVDTVVRSFPLFVADTVIVTDSVLCFVSDSVTMKNDTVTTVVRYERDTITKWKVEVKVKPDTFLLVRVDTVFREVRTEVPQVTEKDFPWLLILMLFTFLMVFTVGMRRYRSS